MSSFKNPGLTPGNIDLTIYCLFEKKQYLCTPKFEEGKVVDVMKEYVVRFSGLKDGSHNFRFDIGRPFFEHFEYGEIDRGVVRVDCIMEKQETMLIFALHIKGSVEVPCDRCNGLFDQSIEGNQELIVKFGDESLEEDENLVVIPNTSYEFDLSHYLFEFIHLMIPARRVHGEDEKGNSLCDREALERLDQHKEQEEGKTDPRWNALKKLKRNKQ